MKLVKAYIRNFMTAKVLRALKDLNVSRVTVIGIKALGDEISADQLQVSAKLGTSYTPMDKIELICNDECVDRVKDCIINSARTGYKGDGLIAVSPVEEAISIRTGDSALQG